MKLAALTSNWNLERIWNKNPYFYQSPLIQHKTHLQAKSTLNHSDNMQPRHTNKNKQFWPKYKIITITKMWKYSIFTEKLVNSCI